MHQYLTRKPSLPCSWFILCSPNPSAHLMAAPGHGPHAAHLHCCKHAPWGPGSLRAGEAQQMVAGMGTESCCQQSHSTSTQPNFAPPAGLLGVLGQALLLSQDVRLCHHRLSVPASPPCTKPQLQCGVDLGPVSLSGVLWAPMLYSVG